MQNNRLYLTQGSGNSFKPALVARQADRTCDYKYINVLAGETRQPEYLAINPQGVVPYLTHPDGTSIGESNAIAWYLAEATPLMPDTALSRAQTVRWMNFEQTALEANISPVRFFTAIAPELGKEHKDMFPVWRERGNVGLKFLDSYLNKREFITDFGYSVADIAVFGYTHLAEEGGFDLGLYPSVSNWIERINNQKGFVTINELLDGEDSVGVTLAA